MLLESDAVHVELSDLMDDLMYYSERFRLSSMSAVQAALVMAADADGLVTVEPTFGAVDASLLPLFLPRDVVRSVGRRPGAACLDILRARCDRAGPTLTP